MKAIFVEARKTPLSFDDAAAAMNAALAAVLQATPSTEVLALALGKCALETGRWRAIWNWNWGNIKSSATYDGFYTSIHLNEVLGQRVVWFAPEGELNRKGGEVIGKRWEVPPGHPQTRMRAYPDAMAGASDYVQFVASGRYKDAWAELLEGDALGYVRALKAKGYFTADEATYARSVLSLQREFVAKLQARPAPELPVMDAEDVHSLIAEQPANREAVRSWEAERAANILQDRLNAGLDLRGGSNLLESETDEETKPDPPRNA